MTFCGGCGETDERKRCIGCMHDFGAPDSAALDPADENTVAECKANVLEFLKNATDAELLAFISSTPFQESQGMLIVRKVLVVWVSLAKEPSDEAIS